MIESSLDVFGSESRNSAGREQGVRGIQRCKGQRQAEDCCNEHVSGSTPSPSHLQCCSALPAAKFNSKAQILLLRIPSAQPLGNSAVIHDPQAEGKFVQAEPIFSKPPFFSNRLRISGVIHSCDAAAGKSSTEMYIKRCLKKNNSS